MSTTPEHRKAFVERLKLACDRNPNIPPPNQGRQQVIAESLRVAPEAVSKWFKGVAMPRHAKMVQLGELLQVDPSWLHFGDEPEMTRPERTALARAADGAVHLAWGLIALSGGHCGGLPANDPRREYVDFIATVGGVAYAMHVALAREIGPGVYEVTVPEQFRELRCVCVIPLGAGKFKYLDLPADMIDRNKEAKGSEYAVVITLKAPGKYMSDKDHWPVLHSFCEFGDNLVY